jgi:hypothetical protein
MVIWFNLVTVISYVVARIVHVAGRLPGFLRLATRNPNLIGSKQGHRAIQLKRPVVSVFVKDWLIIVAKTGDGKSVRRIGFSPKKKGREEAVITVGVTKMRVKVAWSIINGPLTSLQSIIFFFEGKQEGARPYCAFIRLFKKNTVLTKVFTKQRKKCKKSKLLHISF